MKNTWLFILMIGGWLSNQSATAQPSSKQLPAARSGNGSFYYPAEFEPHQAIWIGYRSNELFQPLLTQMIRELTPSVKVNVVIEHDSLLKEGEQYFASRGIATSRIQLVVQSPTGIWYRDPGPIFLKNGQGELRIADFAYSNYQNVPPDSLSEKAIAHGKIKLIRTLPAEWELPPWLRPW